MKNVLHDISPMNGENLNVIVEIQKGSKNKYELDKETGLIKLDRVMKTSQDYPFDYGFVPQTHWHDGDPLDVVLITTYPLLPGILVEARVLGVMDMIDNGESDAKIIAVPAEDPRFDEVQDIADLPAHTAKEIKHFFETYKMIQKKIVEIRAVDGKAKALEVVKEAIELYKNKQ
jgi:inorganic pyrophosphatase